MGKLNFYVQQVPSTVLSLSADYPLTHSIWYRPNAVSSMKPFLISPNLPLLQKAKLFLHPSVTALISYFIHFVVHLTTLFGPKTKMVPCLSVLSQQLTQTHLLKGIQTKGMLQKVPNSASPILFWSSFKKATERHFIYPQSKEGE